MTMCQIKKSLVDVHRGLAGQGKSVMQPGQGQNHQQNLGFLGKCYGFPHLITWLLLKLYLQY